jgi:hypothetical protein
LFQPILSLFLAPILSLFADLLYIFVCKLSCYNLFKSNPRVSNNNIGFYVVFHCIGFNALLFFVKFMTHLIFIPMYLNDEWKKHEFACYVILITYLITIYLSLIELPLLMLFARCKCKYKCMYGKSFLMYALKQKFGDVTITKDTIQKLIAEEKIHIFSPVSNVNDDVKLIENLSCTICLNDFSMKHQIIKLKCSHMFHTSCINIWLRSLPSVNHTSE